MAIDFPDSPSVGDQYVASGKTYQWDGTVWTIYGPQTNPNIFKVDTANNRVGINKTSPTTALDVNGDATAGKFLASGSEANLMPSGTTAERPASPSAGMFRFNTTTGEPEWYSSVVGNWLNFRTAPVIGISYLVLAGGGGAGGPENSFAGGGWHGGGGGAGGYRCSVSGEDSGGGSSAEPALSIAPGTTYTVTVGGGGAGGIAASGLGVSGTDGSNSVFSTITSTGGGGGGGGSNTSGGAGKTGGSGGGGGSGGYSSGSPGAAGTGTVNQGFNGAAGSGSTIARGGGGGGAGAVGDAAASPRNKAAGVSSSISGSSVERGKGGASGAADGSNVDGPANSGDGGDPPQTANGNGRAGGSGVVILRYPNSATATVSAGLTSETTTDGSDKVTIITAGTGTVSWS